jgi:hypothetical protein
MMTAEAMMAAMTVAGTKASKAVLIPDSPAIASLTAGQLGVSIAPGRQLGATQLAAQPSNLCSPDPLRLSLFVKSGNAFMGFGRFPSLQVILKSKIDILIH